MHSIFDYMRDNSNSLGERILETFPPLQGANDPLSPRLDHLLRCPLPAQALAIQGLSNFLQKEDAAKIVAECGTGKTLMALATTYVHSAGRPYAGIIMCPPHLTLKWAREAFITIPRSRVFLIEDMRNGGDPNKAHGVVEVKLIDGKATRRGEQFSLTRLRRTRRADWLKQHPYPCFFVMGRDKGKLGYFWQHAYTTSKTGSRIGYPLNPDNMAPVENPTEGGYYTRLDFAKKRISEQTERPNQGTQMFSPLWSADPSKMQRMAPAEFIGRYLKNWFDYAIADELHQLAGDTAQGNALGALAKAARKLLGLTGTLLGGYADDIYNTLFRMDAPQMVREGFEWGGNGRMDFVRKYGVIETTTIYDEEDNACSRKSKGKITVKRKPGASPMMFGRFLMPNTAFLNLEDISAALPPYDEEVVEVDMPAKMAEAYEYLEDCFKTAIQTYGKGGSVISTMLNTLLLYPDHPFDLGTITARVFDEQSGGFERVWIADAPDLPKRALYPKEERLIETIQSQLAKGRRCQVFVTYTGEHSMLARLQGILLNAGVRSAVLEASVPTEKREAWYESQVKNGTQVVICHPKLVETGLDLLDFPTLVFYETGYSLHTLRQASRRSWRIGQRHDVSVMFFHYSDTMQERCVRLMGKKMLVAMAMEGKFSGEGLNSMGDEDMMTSLARELVEKGGVGESATQIWRDLRTQREKLLGVSAPVTVAGAVGEAVPEEPGTLTGMFSEGSEEDLPQDTSAQVPFFPPSAPAVQPALTGLLQFGFQPKEKKRSKALPPLSVGAPAQLSLFG
jgi:superfamily II DNA or RNA helicase